MVCRVRERHGNTTEDYAGGEQSSRVETIQGVRSELAAKLKSNKGYSKALHNAFRYLYIFSESKGLSISIEPLHY